MCTFIPLLLLCAAVTLAEPPVPQGQYGAPSSQYGAPGGFGTPSSKYGAPSSQYGAPGGFGAPSSQYGAPSSQYGAPGGVGSGGYSGGGGGFPSSQFGNGYSNGGGGGGYRDPRDFPMFSHEQDFQRPAGQIWGKWSVALPDGRVQRVEYDADETGFHPIITYDEPGNGLKGNGLGGNGLGGSGGYGGPGGYR